ncbi:MAG: hypothetical protein AAGI23_13415 [Bacteroidota bacterium]
MKKIDYLLSFVICCVLLTTTNAQRIDYSDDFLQKLEQLHLSVVEPMDAGYKDVMVLKNDVEGYDFAIRSRKEKLEIRYILEAYDATNIMHQLPHLRFLRMLTHLATNEENSLPLATHELPQEDVTSLFGADWGKVAYFQPKGRFTHWRHAKLLSLYKAERGMAHILFLYNKSGLALDDRFYAVQFYREQ